MTRIFLTSDLHFCHDKEFLYRPRGFGSIQEHNEAIVKNWNEVVGEDDKVFILGDIMLNDNEEGIRLFNSLNGDKEIIFGNHDTNARIDRYSFETDATMVGYATVLKYKKFNFYLSHYPTLTSNYDLEEPLRKRVINLCGHSHTPDRFVDFDKGLIYHVELDAHDNKPVLIDDIIEDIKNEIQRRRDE